MALPNFHRLSPKKGGWTLPKGTILKYKKNQGYYTAVGPKGKTPQNRTTIETIDQIEARVRKLADEQFKREQGAWESEAERMRKDAEGRRQGMIDAYAAAGKANAAMAGQVQAGWNLAGDQIQGMGEAGAGTVADALRADLATQDQALARLGAAPGSTGFDPSSQAGVESYRGGYLPAELMTRMGGVANEALLRQGDNLGLRGMQESDVGMAQALADIRTKGAERVEAFNVNRRKNEQDYREMLMGARQDQIDAVNAAKKILADIRNDEAKLRFQYWEARKNATTKLEIAKIDAIYKKEQNRLRALADQALIDQRNASAGLSDARAEDIRAGGDGSGGGTEPPSPSTVSNTVVRATKAGNAAIQNVFDNIWAKTPGAQAPADWVEDDSGPYTQSDKYKAAIKWSNEQRRKSFGTIMDKTIKAISPHLRALGYTPFQIRKQAYQIVSARVQPNSVWEKNHRKFLNSLAGKK